MADVSPAATSPLHAPIKWAQRSDRLLLTVDLHDATDVKIDFTDKSMTFHGVSDQVVYESELEFYDSIDPKASSYKILPRSIQINVMKPKEEQDQKTDPGESKGSGNGDKKKDTTTFWPHLLKEKHMEKNKYELTVDWNRWVDEDEEDEKGLDGFDWANWG